MNAATTSRLIAPGSRVRRRQAVFSDYPQIAAVQAKNGLRHDPEGDWLHLWLDNPAYDEMGEWPIGWVLETQDGQIVGAITNVPQPFEYRGDTLMAAVSRGWAIDRAHRAFDGPKLLRAYFSQEKADLLLSTTTNETAAVAFAHHGASRIPSGCWDRAAGWIADPEGLLKSWLRWKGLPIPRGLSRIAAIAWQAANLRRHFFSPRGGNQHCECANTFDESFDVFWKELRAINFRRLLAVRTRAMLKWHYQTALDRGSAWLLTVKAGGQLIAYAVFVHSDNPQLGLRRMVLADFQTLEADPDIPRQLMSAAVARGHEAHIHLIEAIGCDPESELWRSAVYARQLSTWTYYYKASNRTLGEALRQPSAWNATCFDGDVTL